MADDEILPQRSALHSDEVYRRGDVVVRDASAWAPTVHTLLRHLEERGFPAPRVVGSGFDEDGRETLTYVEGETGWKGPMSLEHAFAVGGMIRCLHETTATYTPPADAQWYPWCGRSLGARERVVGHCDLAPWNIICHDGLPIAFIDWDFAGPTDPHVDLAQACWHCAKLYDDMVAEDEGLPPLADRAALLRAILDGYGLAAEPRTRLVDLILDLIVYFSAWQADEFGITPHSQPADADISWAFAWVSRSAAWIHRNRSALQDAVT